MLSVPISYLHECFDCYAEAGVLVWKKRPLAHFSHLRQCNMTNTRLAGKQVGNLTTFGYLEVQLGGKNADIKIRVHRIIWAMHTGAWPIEFLDHISRDKVDNRIANLREANRSQNGANQEVLRNNKVGLKGVCPHGKRFRAQIQTKGKVRLLGIFDTPELAHQAYSIAALKHHGEYAGGIIR
jgi:hypothetical protein